MSTTRHKRHSRPRLAILAALPLLAWAVQPTVAEETAAGVPTPNASAPKDGAHDTHARGPHPDARGDDARAAPADANEPQVPPTHRVSRKPYVFPRPHHTLSMPARPHHWPTGISSGPARNAIGVVVDRGGGRTVPAFRPMWRAAGPAGLPKVATPGIGTPVTTNGLVRQNTGALIPNPPRSAGINGTGTVRVGSGPGTIGGAPRTTTGINGTSFRPKHGG